MRLTKLLTSEARVAPAVADHMTNTMGMESVSDFVSFFDLSTYQDGVQTDVLDNIPAFRGDKIQRSRLRSAWELARAEFSRALLKTNNIENAAEWDAPLDPDVQLKQEQAFKGLHRLRLEPDATPCDTLFARLFREFKRQTLSVIPLHKVKTVAQTSPIMDTVKRRRLSPDITITLNEADDTETEITDVLQLLRALRVLMTAYAMVGTTERDSKLRPGERVRDADLSECMAYTEFCTTAALAQPQLGLPMTRWLMDRDHQTRVKVRALYADGWPFGEALREAREKHVAVLWTVTTGHMGNPVPVLTSNSQKKPGQDKASKTSWQSDGHKSGSSSSTDFCPDFNSNKGCERKQRECPHHKMHKCSYWTKGQGVCGAWNHSKLHCPNNPDRKRK